MFNIIVILWLVLQAVSASFNCSIRKLFPFTLIYTEEVSKFVHLSRMCWWWQQSDKCPSFLFSCDEIWILNILLTAPQTAQNQFCKIQNHMKMKRPVLNKADGSCYRTMEIHNHMFSCEEQNHCLKYGDHLNCMLMCRVTCCRINFVGQYITFVLWREKIFLGKSSGPFSRNLKIWFTCFFTDSILRMQWQFLNNIKKSS